MLGKSDQIDLLFTVADECDLTRGVMTTAISSSEMDQNTDTFHATVDRTLFKKPVDIVLTVLEANGYVLNLENILSCLDQLVIGIKTRVSPRQIEAAGNQIRNYMPSVIFKMPTKGRIGPLLQKFYQEIEAYEAEVERLQVQSSGKNVGEKEHSKSELRDEIKALRAANRDQKAQLEQLSKSLNDSRTSAAQVERAMVSGNFLPNEIRPATVREILPAERSVAFRTGRKTFHIPMSALSAVPPAGEQCLVHFREGLPRSAFLFESPGIPFQKQFATVLNVESDLIKIRLNNRQRLVLEAKNDTERDAISGIRRGDQIILKIFQRQIVGFEKCATVPENAISDKVQEQIARRQIGVTFTEAVAEDHEENNRRQGEAS
jgi:hypothetical protein